MRNLVAAAALGLIAAGSCAQAQDAPALQATQGKYQTRVFELPKGSHPHDAAPGPDGQIWYTAQQQGALGIIDIASGKFRQVPLGDGSAPHGVIQAADGSAWITDGGQNAIVRFDPKSEKLDVWKLPGDSGYTNLNTAAFAGDGTLWFTGQNGIYGKVDPKTHQVSVFKDPEGRGPYGIDATPAGDIWYVSLAGSHLAQLNRADGSVKLIDPPDANAGLRRVWADSRGDLWISGWNSGKLYRYRPADGSWKSWKAPGDKPQVYAVYVDGRDKVWITEWSSNSTLVFDPVSERFVATIPGSGPNAQVRQILGRGNEVYLPESGLDRLMLVTVAE
jgi:virginiamycin B lyase